MLPRVSNTAGRIEFETKSCAGKPGYKKSGAVPPKVRPLTNPKQNLLSYSRFGRGAERHTAGNLNLLEDDFLQFL